MIQKLFYIVIIAALLGCQKKERAVEKFYENGNIMYSGTFEGKLKKGIHYQYFEDLEGVVQYEAEYQIVNGKEVLIRRKKYNEEGVALYDSRLTDKKLMFESSSDTINLGDSWGVKITIANPKYELVDARWGAIDKNLNILDSSQVHYVSGFDHSVNIQILAESEGSNTLKGYLSDFTIKPINDSIGVTISEDMYFEYKYYVKRKPSHLGVE